jgi:hypothetical protein
MDDMDLLWFFLIPTLFFVPMLSIVFWSFAKLVAAAEPEHLPAITKRSVLVRVSVIMGLILTLLLAGLGWIVLDGELINGSSKDFLIFSAVTFFLLVGGMYAGFLIVARLVEEDT